MSDWLTRLRAGLVIPAHPLCLNAERQLDETRQRALTRYYRDAGAGGIAVAVHTTQFEIRLPQYNLLEPVLRMAIEETRGSEMIMIAGAVGPREQALREAELAAKLGYQAVLLSLSALKNATLDEMVDHVRDVASVLPVVGFYLQPAVGGRLLPFEFWRKAADIENLIAIKMAPFNRYQTLDVIRAVAASDRSACIALYTGNDDNIIADLITPFSFHGKTLRIVGGLLGQWAVGTRRAVEILRRVHEGKTHPSLMLALNAQLTDLNGALFDVANGFHGCIAGIHEVLRRQGLMEGRWCLNPAEDLSPGQMEEIDRVLAAYPHLLD
ncbi:MAG: dihydrodipicolinate synthase family protein [Bryobacteraceae bacterium]|nr:dihydrodipicolinate synthase family protein [Solibacteraceae bacterium]MCO5350648.1 dihydrodipicolinate synthase family protein [Bryobacteraceae bacterium]